MRLRIWENFHLMVKTLWFLHNTMQSVISFNILYDMTLEIYIYIYIYEFIILIITMTRIG